jgi:hypothetical protein
MYFKFVINVFSNILFEKCMFYFFFTKVSQGLGPYRATSSSAHNEWKFHPSPLIYDNYPFATLQITRTSYVFLILPFRCLSSGQHKMSIFFFKNVVRYLSSGHYNCTVVLADMSTLVNL